jgi:ArsR family transcriptional regulator, lead/cadmium/zinc/bismuth-responsive transcriptional repressor
VYIQSYTNWWALLASKTQKQDTDTQALHQIVLTLNRINDKIETILEVNKQLLKINEALLQRPLGKTNQSGEFNLEPDVMDMLNLPAALRKTIMVLYKLEKATADDLAKETSRLRAVESAAANELVRMGYIKKKREGRDVYFYIETPEEKNTYG